MKKMFKKAVSLIVAASMLLSALPTFAETKAETQAESNAADWAIYVYMCGADLESVSGAATSDILEMLKADIPDNVKLIVMTGGANAWDPKEKGAEYNDEVGYEAYITPKVERNQIYEIDDDKMTLLKTYDKYMDMGNRQTTETFIEDAFKLAPANHTMIEFWDHGAGISGAEADEITYNMLNVLDIADIMETAKINNKGNNIDIVGFDACLMSTMEVGYVLSPYADYLLASEEAETGYGWYYGFLSMFGESKEVPSAVDVGKAVIDSYAYSQNSKGDWSKNVSGTLALTDLSKMAGLVEAFNKLSDSMLKEMDNSKSLVEMMRTAESTESMYAGFGMIDLYDFAYRLKSIDSLSGAASRFIKVLGTPPGANDEDYDGYVNSDDYVGWVSGDDPVVLYRGTGSKFNNCIGLTLFYPLSNMNLTGSKRLTLMDSYKAFGLGDSYPLYIMGATSIANSTPLFDGEIVDGYDEENGSYISVEPAEDIDLIKRVDYITTFSEVDEDYSEKTYLLGTEMLTDGWEENKFTKDLYETWYTVNGKPITVIMENCSFADGYDYYYYTIPVVIDDNGRETFATMSCMYIDTVDADSLVDKENVKYLGKMLVLGITPVADGEIAQRSLEPADVMKAKPALAIYDMESGSITGYKVYDETIEFNGNDEDGYELPLDKSELISTETTSYKSYFALTDIQNIVHLSNPMDYVVFQNLGEFYLGPIIPQAYTGEAVEPNIRVLYQGMEMLEEGVDYKVTYSNNVEKGTAKVTVTSLREDIPGELTAEFEICDEDDVAEETMKLLPNHEIIKGCYDSDDKNYGYFEHINLLETIKYFYEHGSKLSDENVKILNDQYEKMLTYLDVSLKNNGVEMIGEYGVFNSEDYRSLIARSTAPVSENANAALKKAGTSGLVDCYYVGMYLPSEDNLLERLDMFPDKTVALKITLPGSVHDDGLEIYRLTDESDEPVPVEYDIINRNGEKYAIFDTDELGYFALFDTEEGYSDVPSDAWYSQGVKYATENGYMSGIGNNKFAPAAPILRCELVKVLYKMSGEPEVDEQSQFKDIMTGSGYENAVAWAVENNIVAGYTEDKFEPYKNVTREQLATILQRYEKYKGADVYGNADIANYTDADDVSEYAFAAVKWACNAGIISGIDGALVPKGNVTRAQLAAILERMG